MKSVVKENSVVLDIGGFDGYISDKIKSVKGVEITIIDLDRAGLKLAGEKGLKTMHASVLELPYESNHADLVLCFDLLEHVEGDRGAVREISRVLKKGGTLVLTTPMEKGVTFPFLDKDRTEKINRGWGHLRLGYSLEELRKMLLDSGLEIRRKSRYFNLLSRFIYRFTFISKAFRLRWSVYEAILKLEPYIKFGSQVHIIEAKKI
ncbi:MAG: class I SAM-dependent methyltransferase [Deltaproteobacteria bacterium]|nr:class I SAM-dependent methyltransferase [Deltaproteobacteria bacterium]